MQATARRSGASHALGAAHKLAAAQGFSLKSATDRVTKNKRTPLKEPDLFAIIQAAGWPIWPLLAVSIIAVALIIERAITLRDQKIVPRNLLEQVVTVYTRQGVHEDVLDKLAKDSPLGQVLSAGLRNHKGSRYVMKDAIEEAGRSVAHELERFLTTLGTIATASPLLGLFGTVIGMIEIFGSQSPTGTNPQQLAHGISIALYNTAFGIGIAIPALICYRHFKNKVDGYVVTMEQAAARLVDTVHGERMDWAPPPGPAAR
jgi:biopolymer transport protein ExbB